MRLFIYYIGIVLFVSANATENDWSTGIWINGDDYEEASNAMNQTIYFPNWDREIEKLRKEGDRFLAIQLDDRFDPLPFDQINLPSLSAIAAVGVNETIEDYLSFLEQFSRTNGFTYLVLPDTTGFTFYEKEILEVAHKQSPNFFIQRHQLRHEVPDSKKEYLASLSVGPHILVASQHENFKRIRKWSAKFFTESHRSFVNLLDSSKLRDFEKTWKLPEALAQQIGRNGIFAVDPDHTLPIVSPNVTYLGTNEKLRDWLSHYATVTSYRTSTAITIVDHLTSQHTPVQGGDILLAEKKLDREDISQLIFPAEFQNREILIAKMLFGSATIKGRDESARFVADAHYLSYSHPTVEGLELEFQREIDSIGRDAIMRYATPGMQLAVVKNGSVVHQQCFGYYTYDSLKPVSMETLYDLASLTKVMATLPAIALLVDREQIQLEDRISQYLPEFLGSNKSEITIKQLLSHNAGLKSYVPFWSMVMGGDRLDAFYYRTPEDEANDVRTYGFEPDPVMLDTLRTFIIASDLIKDPERYNYSDIGFMILHLLVERVTGLSFEDFLVHEFYRPMGLSNTTFNPIQRGVDLSRIAPTEFDQRFRNGLVWGEVHDRNAAVFGGVSGHAGLFSNVTDLAKMMSMYLNGGVYGGRRFLSQEVLSLFNSRHFKDNRRGLGWDKKDKKVGASSMYASDESFGHTGFTGTMVWADPQNELIFVFLSNRIYPDASNNRMSEFEVRRNIHDSLYKSIN